MATTWGEELAICLAANIPAFVWGNPGIGKSKKIEAMAQASGAHLEIVLAGLRDPADFSGYPMITGSGADAEMRMAPPDWAKRAKAAADAGQPSWIFFDEANQATPTTQQALMRVILERQAGDLPLGREVRMVAAGNPPEVSAGGFELPLPLANRFVHIQATVDATEWVTGILSGWPTPAPVMPDPDRFATALARARGLVAAYVSAQPHKIEVLPRDTSTNGFPTPRSWDGVTRLLAAADSIGANAVATANVILGAIGEGEGAAFLAWRDNLDLPDPETVLADPTGYPIPDRGDKRYALMMGVAAAYLGRPDLDRWKRASAVFRRMAEAGYADVAVQPVRLLTAKRPPDAPEVNQDLAVFTPVLVAAGVTKTSTRKK